MDKHPTIVAVVAEYFGEIIQTLESTVVNNFSLISTVFLALTLSMLILRVGSSNTTSKPIVVRVDSAPTAAESKPRARSLYNGESVRALADRECTY